MKNAIIQIDATPFKQWYEQHYGVKVGVKKGKKAAAEKEEATEVKQSKSVQKKLLERQKLRTLVSFDTFMSHLTEVALAIAGKTVSYNENSHYQDPALDDAFASSRLLACISSRPGQSGRCDGYILEGKELDFYSKMLKRARK